VKSWSMAERPAWLKRAMDPSTPVTKARESVRTASIDGRLFPTIRMIDGKLKKFDNIDKAYQFAVKQGDYIQFDNDALATEFSKQLSAMIDASRSVANRNDPRE